MAYLHILLVEMSDLLLYFMDYEFRIYRAVLHFDNISWKQ